jgi:hypothetical protein
MKHLYEIVEMDGFKIIQRRHVTMTLTSAKKTASRKQLHRHNMLLILDAGVIVASRAPNQVYWTTGAPA